MDKHEREERRKLRAAKRQYDVMLEKWSNAFFPDDDEDEPNWQAAEDIKPGLEHLERRIEELESAIHQEYGDLRQVKPKETKRGRRSSAARPVFDQAEKDVRFWLSDSIEAGVIQDLEISEIANECKIDFKKLTNFARKDTKQKLTAAEFARLTVYCQRYFEYRGLGTLSADSLLRFMFWYQDRLGISSSELARLTRLSPETLRKWRTGETEPDLLPVLSCFDALGLSLIPVPKSGQSRFLSVGYLNDEGQLRRRKPISDEWSEITIDDVKALKGFASAFRDLTKVLRARWR